TPPHPSRPHWRPSHSGVHSGGSWLFDFAPVQAKKEATAAGRRMKKSHRIGRPYLPSSGGRIPVEPPFKPYVRFSRTRLTSELLNRCITPPPDSELCLSGDTGRDVRRRSPPTRHATRLGEDGVLCVRRGGFEARDGRNPR